MGEVVNLKRFKKRNAREQSAREAEANRARFGRTKSEPPPMNAAASAQTNYWINIASMTEAHREIARR